MFPLAAIHVVQFQETEFLSFSSMSIAFLNLSSVSWVSLIFFKRAISFAFIIASAPCRNITPYSSKSLNHVESALLLITKFLAKLPIPNSKCTLQYLTASSLNSFVYCLAMFIPPHVLIILLIWESSISNLYYLYYNTTYFIKKCNYSFWRKSIHSSLLESKRRLDTKYDNSVLLLKLITE